MGSLIIIAAGIPFAVILVAVIALASIRYRLTESDLHVLLFGIKLRKTPISYITSVEYLAPHAGQPWNFFHKGGSVLVEYDGPGGKNTMALSPRDAEAFAERLKEQVRDITGREL